MNFLNKTSPLGENWLFLGVIALVGLVLSARDSGAPPPRRDFKLGVSQPSPKSGGVPPPFEMDHQMTEVAAVERISRARIQKAMQLILKLEYDRALNTPDDEEIFRLLHQYEAGQRLYRTTAAIIISKNVGRMAFSCPDHEYAYNPDVQTSTPFLALSLYHELKHGVQCQQGIELPGTDDDLCRYEASAYAAQVRFLIALHRKGMLPDVLSAEEPSDAGLMVQTLEAWDALAEGEEAFCRWFRRELRWGALVVLQDGSL